MREQGGCLAVGLQAAVRPASRRRGCRKWVLLAHAQKSWNLPVNAVRRTALHVQIRRGIDPEKTTVFSVVLGHVVHAGFVL